MDRAYLGQFVAGQYGALLIAAGFATATDNLNGFSPALDAVMTQLGLPTLADGVVDPTVDAGKESDALLLTRYFVLDWLLLALSAQVDTTDGKDKISLSQLSKQVTILLDRAQQQVPPQYNVTPGDFAYGRLQLDIFEPDVFSGLGNPGYRLG